MLNFARCAALLLLAHAGRASRTGRRVDGSALGISASLTRRALVGSAVLLPAASALALVQYAPARYSLVPQGNVLAKQRRLAEVVRDLERKPEDPYLLGERAQLEYDIVRLQDNAAGVQRLRGCAASGGAYAASLSLRVPDLQAAKTFWLEGLKLSELRSGRAGPDRAESVVLGFGREGLAEDDGGKFSIELIQATASSPAPVPLPPDSAPVAGALLYVQMRVPNVRITGLIKAGGEIESAYGYVEVISPGGLGVRVITSARRDPFEFVALRVPDVEAAASFYERAFKMKRVVTPPMRTARDGGLLGTGLFGSEYEVLGPEGMLAPSPVYGSVLMVPGCCPQADAFGILLVPPEAKGLPPGVGPAQSDPFAISVLCADAKAARAAAGADTQGRARDPAGVGVEIGELKL